MLLEILDQSEIVINKARKSLQPKGAIETVEVPDYDFFLTIYGHFTLNINGKEYSARAGDSFIIPPNSTFTLITHEDSAHYLFHFSILYLQRISLVGKLSNYKFTPTHSKLIELFGEYMALFSQNPIYYAIPLKSLCNIIISEMLLQNEENLNEFISDNIHTASDSIIKIIRYIHEHPGINLKNSTLAELSGFNKSYFSRYFKKQTGMTVIKYIENVTMKVAKHLLLDKKLPIKEIAEQLGFSDQFAFSKWFKSHFGFSPSVLKKMKI